MRDNKNEAENILSIEKKLDEIVSLLNNENISDYFDMMTNKKRRIFISFANGIARGFGMAIGFTILGALAIYLLRQIVMLNLPIIGDFIAELVKIVQDSL